MLLNAQGCTHEVQVEDAAEAGVHLVVSMAQHGTRVETDDPDGMEVGETVGTPGDSPSLEDEEGEEIIDVGTDRIQGGVAVMPGNEKVGPIRPSGVVKACRCRQATRLLTRLVRGLPGEAPAVVVRHAGLRSIVELLNASGARGTGGEILTPSAEAAAGGALEVSWK